MILSLGVSDLRFTSGCTLFQDLRREMGELGVVPSILTLL